jgi:hypothetical protein
MSTIYYTVCPQFTAQFVHNLLHIMSTIYCALCPQFTTQCVYNLLRSMSTIYWTVCPQFTAQCVHNLLHNMSTIYYTICPQFTTQYVHNLLHIMSTISLFLYNTFKLLIWIKYKRWIIENCVSNRNRICVGGAVCEIRSTDCLGFQLVTGTSLQTFQGNLLLGFVPRFFHTQSLDRRISLVAVCSFNVVSFTRK